MRREIGRYDEWEAEYHGERSTTDNVNLIQAHGGNNKQFHSTDRLGLADRLATPD